VAWVYDFGLRYEDAGEVDTDAVKDIFQDAFAAAWRGETENDSFNALVLRAGLTWRKAMILRAYAKYLRQAATTFSQNYVETTVNANLPIARMLVELFESRFDPAMPERRQERTAELAERIERALDNVESLDEDRILRSYLSLVQATLRTNYFQRDADGQPKPHLSLKFDPTRIPDLPPPRPRFEIFVYSPAVEGVHLRFGPVARGGLRWSDRREDFRTEVLGLVKAQMVKNAVIVPVGAKGGFVVKRPPGGGDRDRLMTEVVACYRTFIRGLLDLTDNLVAERVVPPPDVVRHDGDDTYLVVAADKGTATFSDIANGVAKDYGFWLGDAFASGGSAGYDHKAMGITARGAWESVKRHFHELGIDIQTTDVAVVGIGDMSGDVFGNGMLLSEHLRLVAAFDHRHVFVDPSPDAATSYAERRRLFALPRSSWADYDPSLISAGGGVWPRSAKAIPVSPEAAAVLGVEPGSRPPAEVIRAMLRAPVDLLWNGGIGTYVKASTETHVTVGDKSNDAVRVDGRELRARVVGEGGNLGFTQLGRIEFAMQGGRINTDALDNSAGVDTSDHEVNIKILLDGVVRSGDMTGKQRNALLAEMTDEVASLVLRDNYGQNVALANARAQAVGMLHVHQRYLHFLERTGKLERALEFLPDDGEISRRRVNGLGLTSPELAVLLAYSKITLSEELLASDLPEDPYLRSELERYFPTPLRERFRPRMEVHPLRREIVATCVVNNLVNNAGMTFAHRIGEETGATVAEIARAHTVARAVFDMQQLWDDVEALDNVVPTDVQTAMMLEGRRLIERASRWLLRNRRPPIDVAAVVDFFRKEVAAVVVALPSLLCGSDATAHGERVDRYVRAGVPEELARRVAGLAPAFSALDITEAARVVSRPVEEVAAVYFALGDRLRLSRLRDRIVALPREDRWQTMARAALLDDLNSAYAALTADVLVTTDERGSVAERIDAWLAVNAFAVGRVQDVLDEIGTSEKYDLATLSVALREIRGLVSAAGLSFAR
jgi:glutamate dehydrogenase